MEDNLNCYLRGWNVGEVNGKFEGVLFCIKLILTVILSLNMKLEALKKLGVAPPYMPLREKLHLSSIKLCFKETSSLFQASNFASKSHSSLSPSTNPLTSPTNNPSII
jgi:hypothetical protein